jgi:hypothetical protein
MSIAVLQDRNCDVLASSRRIQILQRGVVERRLRANVGGREDLGRRLEVDVVEANGASRIVSADDGVPVALLLEAIAPAEHVAANGDAKHLVVPQEVVERWQPV